MNNFNLFGIGPMELVFILIIALVVLGPERLPQVAREASKLIRQMREIYAEIMGTLQKEFGDLEEFKEIKEISNSLRDPLNLNNTAKPAAKSSSKPVAKPAPAPVSPTISTEVSTPPLKPVENGVAAAEENRIAPPILDAPAEETPPPLPSPSPIVPDSDSETLPSTKPAGDDA